jgi:hypothetical protein
MGLAQRLRWGQYNRGHTRTPVGVIGWVISGFDGTGVLSIAEPSYSDPMDVIFLSALLLVMPLWPADLLPR